MRWNPFGRFFVLAGIGNLPGDLSFYDKKADGKCKLMAATRCVPEHVQPTLGHPAAVLPPYSDAQAAAAAAFTCSAALAGRLIVLGAVLPSLLGAGAGTGSDAAA